MENSLLDNTTGERLYLNDDERKAFLKIARKQENDIKYFSLMLYYTGCRLNEALGLTIGHIDFENQSVVIRSLKKKGKIHYRHIPLPENFLDELAGAYDLRKKKKNKKRHKEKIWGFTDRTGRRYVTKIMQEPVLKDYAMLSVSLRWSMIFL